MSSMPRSWWPDDTVPFRLDPYRYVSGRCRRLGSDVFQTRLLLQKTVCMMGEEAAALFYDESRFQRHGAPPRRVLKTLFGRGGVQGLDDAAHRHRKAVFMALMTPEKVGALVADVEDRWRQAMAERWGRQDRVVLYDAAREVLTRAVCAWAGVPLAESEVARRTADLTAMFDGAGEVGPGYWRARLGRIRGDRWIERVIEAVRAGRIDPPEGSAARLFAEHRDLQGRPLPARVAAVDLLSVLRPTVAVSVYITFVAHALHLHPDHRERIANGDDAHLLAFVEEVRRYYPFFPTAAARPRHDFEWRGYRFREGTRTLLDLYGTNHDPRVWDEPDAFRPERFATPRACPFGFIPQGGGDPHVHHRCPGEPITLALMMAAAKLLTRAVVYEVPQQDLQVDFRRLPALPRSRFVMRNVQPA